MYEAWKAKCNDISFLESRGWKKDDWFWIDPITLNKYLMSNAVQIQLEREDHAKDVVES